MRSKAEREALDFGVIQSISLGDDQLYTIAARLRLSSHIRRIDRALQNLRRAGKIVFVNGHWIICSQEKKQ